jgi:hypothetical protein
MHTRGKRAVHRADLPDNKTEQINCADWNFNWHIVSVYADDVAPIYPAGTSAARISWRQFGEQGQPRSAQLGRQRQPDDRRDGICLITWHDFTDDEYQAAFDARKGVKKTSTSQGQPQ